VSSGGNRYALHIVDLSSLILCMVRACVAGGFIDLAALRSCIDVSGLALERIVAPAIMAISARAFSLPDRPQAGPICAPGRPILHLVASSCRPLRGNGGYVICSLLISAVPLFVR
jgi:hypothetical protein